MRLSLELGITNDVQFECYQQVWKWFSLVYMHVHTLKLLILSFLLSIFPSFVCLFFPPDYRCQDRDEEEKIYNIPEIFFQMGVKSLAQVFIGTESSNSLWFQWRGRGGVRNLKTPFPRESQFPLDLSPTPAGFWWRQALSWLEDLTQV